MTVPRDPATGPLLFDLATVTALVTALVYFTGWTYAYHYFGYFKLGLLRLEIPTQYFFVYGFWVFQTGWWLLAPYAVVVVLVGVYEPRLSPWLDTLRIERPRLLKQLQVLGVLLAFVLAWLLATLSAQGYYQAQQDQEFLAYPAVRVWPNPPLPEDARLRALYEELPTGVYRLLIENRDTLFLFKLPLDGKPARLPVIELPLSEVRVLRVLP